MIVKNRIILINLVGVVVLLAAAFGVEVTPEQQEALITVFGLIGCAINVYLAKRS